MSGVHDKYRRAWLISIDNNEVIATRESDDGTCALVEVAPGGVVGWMKLEADEEPEPICLSSFIAWLDQNGSDAL